MHTYHPNNNVYMAYGMYTSNILNVVLSRPLRYIKIKIKYKKKPVNSRNLIQFLCHIQTVLFGISLLTKVRHI